MSVAALHIDLLDVDFEVIDSPEPAEHWEKMADRFRRAVTPGWGMAR